MPIRIRTSALPATAAPTGEPSFLQRMGGIRGLLGTGVRVGGGFLSAPGGPVGAIVGGSAEGLAEQIEGSNYSPARIATEAALSAVPLASIYKMGKPLESALRGGALSAVGTAGRELAAGREFDPRATVESAGLGGLMGLLLGKISAGPSAAAQAKIPPRAEIEQTSQIGGRVGPGLREVVRPLASIKPSGQPIRMQGEARGIEGLGQDVAPDLYPRVMVGGPSEGPIYRSGTKQALASEAEDFLAQEEARLAPPVSITSKADRQLNDLIISDQLQQEAANAEAERILRGQVPGKISTTSSSKGVTPEGETVTQTIGWKRQGAGRGAAIGGKRIRLKTAPISREAQLQGIEVPESQPQQLTPEMAKFIQEHDVGNIGVPSAPPTSVEAGLEGFGPSGVQPTGLAKFFNVQQPLESPRAPKVPSLRAQQQAEAERLLKQKMAEESQPRPAEWDQYPPEVAQELDRLGLAYRSAPEGLEKRGLGAQLQELKMFMSGKRKSGEPYMRESWRGAAAPKAEAPVAAPTAVPPTETDWIAQETAKADELAGRLGAQSGVSNIPSSPDWVNEQLSLVDRLKKLYSEQGGGGGERGAIDPMLLARLGLGAGGAVLGAATDPLGNPLASAAMGGAAGFAAPSIAKGLASLGANNEMVQEAQQTLAAEGPKKTAQRILETWPQWQRFSMLSSLHGLPANALFGPFGSAMTGAVEAGLSGDPRGWTVAKMLMDPSIYKKIPEAYAQAVELIRNGDIGRAETILYNSKYGRALSAPGVFMTTGDVVAREIIQDAGFPEDVARRMTLTNEPEMRAFQRIANFTKGSPALETVMPFTRTLANLAEQGSFRAPIIGTFVQALREAPDPVRTQLIQQAMSLGIGGSNYFLGKELDPETAKIVRRYATNLAGRYGLVAATGFAAGQAAQRGQSPLSAGVIRGVQEALPLPTTEVPESWARFLFGEGPTPRGILPFQENIIPPAEQAIPKALRIRIRR